LMSAEAIRLRTPSINGLANAASIVQVLSAALVVVLRGIG